MSEDSLTLNQSLLAIRALAFNNSCRDELLTESLIRRTAEIASEYKDISRTCSAVLAIFSYQSNAHAFLSLPPVMKIIFDLVSADDIPTR